MAGVINDLIREIVVTEMGVTAITITHDMTSVRAIADQVAMLHDGKIRWTGPWPTWTAAATPMDSSSRPIEAR
jgi:phospholipid/cholesterol/gamma-HCH transport system ATP-binding protein